MKENKHCIKFIWIFYEFDIAIGFFHRFCRRPAFTRIGSSTRLPRSGRGSVGTSGSSKRPFARHSGAVHTSAGGCYAKTLQVATIWLWIQWWEDHILQRGEKLIAYFYFISTLLRLFKCFLCWKVCIINTFFRCSRLLSRTTDGYRAIPGCQDGAVSRVPWTWQHYTLLHAYWTGNCGPPSVEVLDCDPW